jgi:hypothetical protein
MLSRLRNLKSHQPYHAVFWVPEHGHDAVAQGQDASDAWGPAPPPHIAAMIRGRLALAIMEKGQGLVRQVCMGMACICCTYISMRHSDSACATLSHAAARGNSWWPFVSGHVTSKLCRFSEPALDACSSLLCPYPYYLITCIPVARAALSCQSHGNQDRYCCRAVRTGKRSTTYL